MLEAILKASAELALVDAPSLLAGEWTDDGLWSERTGPYLRRVVSRARIAAPGDVARAAAYARQGAHAVAALAPAARAEILERAARGAAERRDDLARLLALELGKPLKDSRGEIDRVADTLAVCAAEARQIGGELLPVAGWGRGAGTTAMTYRAPAGVALAITPFNAPAPATSTAIVALLLEAGMPADAVQLLHGSGDVGAALCAVDEVAVISFTGAHATGAAVARAAGPKRLVLELGGNAATIVCEDADIGAAARVCASTGYSNSGQSCISVQRVYVQRSRYAAFLEAFAAAASALRVGDPLDPATDVGSMVDDDAAERVVRWTAEAAAGGGRVVLGGRRDGATVAPTIVADPPAGAAVVIEEVFGALVAVMPYDGFPEVIATCNASRFGLQAGLFSNDLGRIVSAWRELEVGGLVVNGSSNFRLDHVPFGGVKDSGFGRESPRCMIEDYTVVKTLLLRGVSVWGERR